MINKAELRSTFGKADVIEVILNGFRITAEQEKLQYEFYGGDEGPILDVNSTYPDGTTDRQAFRITDGEMRWLGAMREQFKRGKRFYGGASLR